MPSELRELYIRLQVEHGDAKSQMNQLKAEVKAIDAAYREAAAGAEGYANATDAAQAKVNELTQKLTAQQQIVAKTGEALEKANAALKGSQDGYAASAKSLEEAKAKHEGLQAAINKTQAAYDHEVEVQSASTDTALELAAALDTLNKDYAQAESDIKKYEGALKSSEKAIGEKTAALSRAKAAVSDARTEEARLGQELDKTNQKLKHHVTQLEDASKKLKTFGADAKSAGQAQQRVAGQLSAAVTAPIVAAGGYAVKAAIDWESSFTSVRKTVNGTAEDLKKIEDGLLGMTNVPTHEGVLADIAANAGQLGIATENVLGFTRTMADLTETTDLAAEQGAQDMARFANITKMPQSEFDRLGSTVVELGNNLATTESQIMDMSMRLASAGSNAGMTNPEIVAIAASLSSLGLESQAGGSAFSKAIIAMQVAAETGSSDLKDFADVAGMTSQQFADAWKADAAGALTSFVQGLSTGSKSAIVMLDEMGITEVRMRDALLRASNASELFAGAIEMGSDAWRENTALAAEAELRYGTVESRMQGVAKEARNAARTFGQDMVPYLESGMSTVSGLVERFNQLDKAQRDQILMWGAVAASIGPVLGIMGKANTMLGGAGKALGAFTGNMAEAGGGAAGLFGALGKLLGPAGVVAVGAAVGYAAYKWYDWASGAKAAREATEGMLQTAKEWASTQAKTVYDTGNDPFARFKVSKESFGAAQSAEAWLAELKQVWSDGEKETDEIVGKFAQGFKGQSDSIRDAVEARNRELEGLGVEVPPEMAKQQQAQLKQLEGYDKEVEQLLKKRKNKLLSDKDQKRLDEVIELRAQLKVDLGLDENGYGTIIKNAQAEIARLAAAGEKPGTDLFGDAMKGAAKGRASVNESLDETYRAEYKLIQAMEDEQAKAEALAALDAKYAADRKTAAEEYARALAEIYETTYTPKEGGDEAEGKIKTLTDLITNFQIANAVGKDTSGILAQMDELTKGMDEGELASYYAMLSQIQEALTSSGQSAQELFPDIPDPTKALKGYQALQKFLDDNETQFEGLQKMFGKDGALGDEVKRVLVEVDVMKADEDLATWLAKERTVTVTGLDATGATISTLPTTEALITSYRIAEEEGFVHPSAELDGIITKYEKGEELTTDEVNALVQAIVQGYETNSDADPSLVDPLVTALITDYKDNTDDTKKAELKPEFDALVKAWKETVAGTGSKEALLNALTAYITKYDDSGAEKPGSEGVEVEVTLDIRDIDSKKVEAWRAKNQGILGTFEAPVKLGLLDDDETKAALRDGAVNLFGADGLPIPVTPAVLETLSKESLVVGLDEQGYLNIIVVPKVGTPEGVQEAEGMMNERAAPLLPDYVIDSTQKKLEQIRGLQDEIAKATAAGDDVKVTDKVWELVSKLMLLDPSDLQNMGAYISQALSALSSPDLKPEDAALLQDQIDAMLGVIKAAETYQGVGGDVSAGIADGMKNYGWSGDAAMLATDIETELRNALETHSPSQLTVPIGEDVAAGIGQGASGYDFSPEAATMAGNLSGSIADALASIRGSADPAARAMGKGLASSALAELRTMVGDAPKIGKDFGAGLNQGLSSSRAQLMATARSIAAEVKQTIKQMWEINSPSKAAMELSKQFGAGLNEGLIQSVPDIIGTTERLSRQLLQMQLQQLQPVGTGMVNSNNQSSSMQVSIEKAEMVDKRSIDQLADSLARRQKQLLKGMGG